MEPATFWPWTPSSFSGFTVEGSNFSDFLDLKQRLNIVGKIESKKDSMGNVLSFAISSLFETDTIWKQSAAEAKKSCSKKKKELKKDAVSQTMLSSCFESKVKPCATEQPARLPVHHPTNGRVWHQQQQQQRRQFSLQHTQTTNENENYPRNLPHQNSTPAFVRKDDSFYNQQRLKQFKQHHFGENISNNGWTTAFHSSQTSQITSPNQISTHSPLPPTSSNNISMARIQQQQSQYSSTGAVAHLSQQQQQQQKQQLISSPTSASSLNNMTISNLNHTNFHLLNSNKNSGDDSHRLGISNTATATSNELNKNSVLNPHAKTYLSSRYQQMAHHAPTNHNLSPLLSSISTPDGGNIHGLHNRNSLATSTHHIGSNGKLNQTRNKHSSPPHTHMSLASGNGNNHGGPNGVHSNGHSNQVLQQLSSHAHGSAPPPPPPPGVHVHPGKTHGVGILANQNNGKINENRNSPPHMPMKSMGQRNNSNQSRNNHLKHEEEKHRSLPLHVSSAVEQNIVRSKQNEMKQKANLWASRPVEKKTIKKKKKKVREANYFIALKVTNPSIKRKVQSIQSTLKNRSPELAKHMIPDEGLCIVLSLLNLPSEEDMWNAVEGFKSFGKKKLHGFLSSKTSCRLSVEGVKNFKKRVLYVTLRDDVSRDKLKKIHDSLRSHFKQIGVDCEYHKKFEPHLTFCKIQCGESKTIPVSAFECLNDFSLDFGFQFVHRLDFCQMHEGFSSDSSYRILASVAPNKVV